MTRPRLLIVMGVAGAGKTTLGARLAERLGWDFLDADQLHPAANVEKMRSGMPLSDADRWPWLDAVGDWIDARLAAGRFAVVACSALKRAYRDRLRGDRGGAALVYIEGSQALIERRLAGRHGHYWPAALLPTQFADLEPPAADEHPIIVDASLPIEAAVSRVTAALA
jgi:gluconokinase